MIEPSKRKGGFLYEHITNDRFEEIFGTEPNITKALDGVTLSIEEVGVSNPPIMFSKVDLPLPEVPTMATNSPSSMDRVTPSNAFVMFGSVP